MNCTPTMPDVEATIKQGSMMTAKSNFTKQQWQLLLDVPPAVGTAVMVAGQSGLGSVKEAMAMANSLLGARRGYEGIELVESLVDARINHGEKSSIETLHSPYAGKEPSEVIVDATAKCRAVAQLLAEKAMPEEVAAYKRWAMDVGQSVAEAAKEGGFLGIGGERVSEHERAALDAISEALHSC
jgi:hypothetical protein